MVIFAWRLIKNSASNQTMLEKNKIVHIALLLIGTHVIVIMVHIAIYKMDWIVPQKMELITKTYPIVYRMIIEVAIAIKDSFADQIIF